MFTNHYKLKNWLMPVLFFLCSATITFAQKKEVPLYKNPKAAVPERVKDLLGRMTIEEKVGQLCLHLRNLKKRLNYIRQECSGLR
jgi:beta-glucosidase